MIRAALVVAAAVVLLFAYSAVAVHDTDQWVVDTTAKYKGHSSKGPGVAVCVNRWGEEIDVPITPRQLAQLERGDPCPR